MQGETRGLMVDARCQMEWHRTTHLEDFPPVYATSCVATGHVKIVDGDGDKTLSDQGVNWVYIVLKLGLGV